MEKSLEYIYGSANGISSHARKFLCSEVYRILDESENTQACPIRSALSLLWVDYDLGGHSIGRSLRSLLLEEALQSLDAGEHESVKSKISLLLAMYHSPIQVNLQKWYDYPVTHYEDTSLRDRARLLVAGILLGVDVLPDVDSLSLAQIAGRAREKYVLS